MKNAWWPTCPQPSSPAWLCFTAFSQFLLLASAPAGLSAVGPFHEASTSKQQHVYSSTVGQRLERPGERLILERRETATETESSPLTESRRSLEEQHPKVAVCLVGGARVFQATGPSILKYVIKEYSPCDIFLNAPLDHNAGKFWAITPPPEWGSSLKAIRIFSNLHMDSTLHPTHILRINGSPKGVQGLLQYFRLVEGCLEMVLKQEKQQGWEYQWIARVRVDSLWQRPIQPLSEFDPEAYNIPRGNAFKGFNDRFGIGPHEHAIVSMRRLSALRHISDANLSSDHTSEKAYRMQFVLARVKVTRLNLPFCVLTQRLPPFQLQVDPCNPAVPSLATPVDLDGVKCIPCSPCQHAIPKDVSGPLLRVLEWDPEGEKASKLVYCNLSEAWMPGIWQPRFDSAVSSDLAAARQEVASASYEKCVQRFSEMQSRTQSWQAPTPETLCVRARLGGAEEIGDGLGSFNTFTSVLSKNSVILTATITEGEDRSWDHMIITATRARITQCSQEDIEDIKGLLTSLGVPKADVLKMSAEGYESKNLHSWSSKGKDIPVCQLLISFPKKSGSAMHPTLHDGWDVARHYVLKHRLDKIGFHLDSCVGGEGTTPTRCLFFSTKYC